MSTAGAHVEAANPSSSSAFVLDRVWSKSRFIRSWIVIISRNGSHRTIAISFPSLPSISLFLVAFAAEVFELSVNDIAFGCPLRPAFGLTAPLLARFPRGSLLALGLLVEQFRQLVRRLRELVQRLPLLRDLLAL